MIKQSSQDINGNEIPNNAARIVRKSCDEYVMTNGVDWFKKHYIGHVQIPSKDWRMLYFGKVNTVDMRQYTPFPDWQKVRLSMKGTGNDFKFTTLCKWLVECDFSVAARVQVTNYVTALSRGGLILPEQYNSNKYTI